MPVLQLNEQQFPLSPRPTRIGAGMDADLTLPTDPTLGVLAVIEPAGGNALVIRRAAPSALVRVNGVVLGAEPTPLMHGDKVEIGGLELRYADDAKGGATQFVNASDLAALVGAKRGGVARATTASGGRLISLVDGKEYLVPEIGLVIGRDASCDIVVGQNEVSRRHAEIGPGDGGYVVRDTSANGVFVNGERVQGSHRLMRSDVLRVGSEEFRFYADVLSTAMLSPVAPAAPPAEPAATASPFDLVPVEPTAPDLDILPSSDADMSDLELLPELEPVPAAAPSPARATEPVARAVDSPPPAAPPRKPVSDALPTAPALPVSAAAEDTRPVLATLEILNEGPTKGTKVSLRTPLAHVGRGAHNDVKLTDESVSETHAKLQRRDDGWYLVDMESTNGSYVGGTRVNGERRIDGSPDLRFGGVKMRFLAAGAAEVESKGTRAIAAVERPRGTSSAAAPVAETPTPRGGVPAWVWILAAAVLAAAAFFVLKGRA